jgi:hypothetical protein
MRKLHIENRVFDIPEHVNEMTVSQLVCLSKLIDKEIPIQEIKVKMLFHCLKAKVKMMKNKDYHRIRIDNDVFALTTEQIVMVSSAFDYLFTKPDDNGHCFFDNRLTKNPIPSIKIKRKLFESPADSLTNISYNQYIYLETYYSVMQNKPEALFAFLGCMFLNPNSIFNSENLNIRYMKLIKPEFAILMCWYYIGCIRFIADKFPRIFPENKNSSSVTNVYDGQMKLLDFMAKADPTKKRLIREDNLFDVLYSLDYLIESTEKQNE